MPSNVCSSRGTLARSSFVNPLHIVPPAKSTDATLCLGSILKSGKGPAAFPHCRKEEIARMFVRTSDLVLIRDKARPRAKGDRWTSSISIGR